MSTLRADPGRPVRSGGRRAALLLVTLAGCSNARPVDGEARCSSWQEQVGALVQTECASCHGGRTPAGGNDPPTISGVSGGGRDELPNAVAGDGRSRLLSAIRDAKAPPHAAVAKHAATLERWLVKCEAAYDRTAIHTPGIMNPGSTEFHGALLRGQAYDFAPCAKCHGADFRGGKAQVGCFGCHDQGPTACDTCHDAVPKSGAHLLHVEGGRRFGRSFQCTECHLVPSLYTDVGHLFAGDGKPDLPPAEIIFGATAKLTPPRSRRAGEPTYDAATKRCTNVYCHGGAWPDANAKLQAPRWSDAASAGCDSCHGETPASHKSDRCAQCHRLVVDTKKRIIARALHLDGKISLGDGTAACSGCHGTLNDPAPPRDLDGNADSPAVGLHRLHLQANKLRGPVQCGDCHLVPRDVLAVGHLDSALPAEVFPNPLPGSFAFSDGATPTWDHAAGRCSNVYCHGGGKKLGADVSAVERAPKWSGGAAPACGSACHGAPPDDGKHSQGIGLRQCVNCHPATVDSSGAIVWRNGTTLHLNGVVDAQP